MFMILDWFNPKPSQSGGLKDRKEDGGLGAHFCPRARRKSQFFKT
ncbi:MAG: hypothetical protein ACLPSF_07395 [Methylocella sp.]